eukprot:CAMPEP_0176312478 /NCGR_PEP_ID=MMETSP0121_2-20121125/66684_1 /TAXON_ID=160619 /ORGANISM="Kryptoperidinium foliaceum, Strain CCMP 1326" /LENGTH=136 /DNA_ID=CAMNT_0017654551 /DNA_START=51 /DNA_END=461 /DNA_ORIENTATION=+
MTLALEEPRWSRAIAMVPRNPLRRLLRQVLPFPPATLEQQQGLFLEGMPVYRVHGDGQDGDVRWVVSRGGRWHFGWSRPGRSFAELVECGFFEMRGIYANFWGQRSAPHGGRGPDEVKWERGQRSNMKAVGQRQRR